MSLLLLGKGQTKCLCYKKTNLNNHARLKHMLMKSVLTPYHSQFNFQNKAPESLILTNFPTECFFRE